MRRLFLQILLPLFVLSTSLTIFPETSLFAVESNIFDSTSYDFKGIPRYTKPRHSFIFTNQSEDVLRLVAARTSCQCTQVYVPDKREYKQGEKGEVVAEIDAVRFTGARHATLTLTFERSGRVFEVPLNVVGMVVENVKLTPTHLDFIVDELNDRKLNNGELHNGVATSDDSSKTSQLEDKTRSRVVTVQYLHSNETAVKATSSSPYVDVKLGKTVKDRNGSSIPLIVSIADDAPAGYINATVSIWSNGASRATPLMLDVSGVVRAPLMISPPTLTFFTSPDGKKVVKNIVVSASNPFTLKEVVSDTESIGVNISAKSIRASKVCVVPISFDPSKLRDGTGLAHIQVKTTDGRALSLDAQISSGNFEANGLVQRVEVLPEIDESFADEKKSEVSPGVGSPNFASKGKNDVRIVDASATVRESETNSELQRSESRVNSRYSSPNSYVPRSEFRSSNSYQTSPKTSRLTSDRLPLR